ncbi:hypothetical protein H1R20_g3247, partial [Candolleomyces eurysporus]
MRLAVAGGYRPASFEKWEYDLAAVIYELGGDGALHALHKSPIAFPCRQTVIKHRQDFKLRLTVGEIKISDICHNIELVFKDVPPSHQRVGITLMMDEIATDGRMCYLPDTDECAGLCEHAAERFPSMKVGESLEVVRAIAAAVCSGEIHIGQEVFVAAFARNDATDYSAKPVLIFPTCKSGTSQTSALIIEKLRQAWQISPYGEALHGPIWSIASDGDPKRRPALYLQCMSRELRPEDSLFSHLGSLQGMNLMTGPDFETHDLDYKHSFKRKLFNSVMVDLCI